MHPPLNVRFKHEIRPCGFRVTASWRLTKRLKWPPWFSTQALHQTDSWDPTSFHHVWLGLFTSISYEISFQRCCKRWIGRLEFYKDRACPCSTILLLTFQQFLNTVYPEQRMGRDGQTIWPARSTDLIPYILIYGDICILLFVLQKSVTFNTGNNIHRPDITWFVRHLKFSSLSCSRCSDVQRRSCD